VLLIGLTGGIASGKTLVSDKFASLGVPVIDADVLAREVVAKGSDGLHALTRHFTTAILTPDGELDRAALRRIVFANPPDREFLDKTLHPMIRALSESRIADCQNDGHAYAIYAVPLLVETSQQDRFDQIIVVDVPVSVQLERLMQRDQSNETEAKAIIASQASREERLAIADYVIDNAKTKEESALAVENLHATILKLTHSNS